MTRREEKTLTKACLAQDRQAQKRLFEMYGAKMLARAIEVLGREDLAKDALQEAFVDVFLNLADFRGGSLEAWIRTNVTRKCLKMAEKEKRYEPTDEEALDTKVEWEDGLLARELQAAIGRLSPQQRAVFLMYYIDGHSHKKIGKMAGITEQASRVCLHRAKQALMKILASTKQV